MSRISEIDWKKRLEEILPYLMMAVIIYYGCILFVNNESFAMIAMLVIMPVGSFFCSYFCGVKRGFRILYLVLHAIAFLPQYWVAIPDWKAMIFYMCLYSLIALMGMTLGWLTQLIVRKLMQK